MHELVSVSRGHFSFPGCLIGASWEFVYFEVVEDEGLLHAEGGGELLVNVSVWILLRGTVS